MNQQEQFLQSTEPDKLDILEQPLVPETPAKEPETGEIVVEGETTTDDDATDGKPRNRRERRLQIKLDAERESNIFQAGKLAAFTEVKSSITEESDYLKSVERIYGNDTPEAQLATDLLKKAFIGVRDEAKKSAIEELRAERQNEQRELAQADTELDTMLENIEDEYGVTLTEPQEKAFFQLMAKMSPKDRDGNVIAYADAHSVYEVLQDKLKAGKGTDNRAKDLSSRSMIQSGSSKDSKLSDDVGFRFLKDNGIL